MQVVLVTGQGMPDIATRAMISQIMFAGPPPSPLHFQQDVLSAPAKCVMGLVDWNPSGCYILCNYKFGNKKATKQSTSCAPELLTTLSSIWYTHMLCLQHAA